MQYFLSIPFNRRPARVVYHWLLTLLVAQTLSSETLDVKFHICYIFNCRHNARVQLPDTLAAEGGGGGGGDDNVWGQRGPGRPHQQWQACRPNRS